MTLRERGEAFLVKVAPMSPAPWRWGDWDMQFGGKERPDHRNVLEYNVPYDVVEECVRERGHSPKDIIHLEWGWDAGNYEDLQGIVTLRNEAPALITELLAELAEHKLLLAGQIQTTVIARQAVADVVQQRNKAQDQLKEMHKLLGMDTRWPVRDVLARLIEATSHLLDLHNCDCHGHEGARVALNEARGYVASIDTALVVAKENDGVDLPRDP